MMTPEQHSEHMEKMKAGISQAIEILNGLLTEETKEQETEGQGQPQENNIAMAANAIKKDFFKK